MLKRSGEMTDAHLTRTMRDVASGDVGPRDAKLAIGSFLEMAPERGARKTYLALQEVVWRLLRARPTPKDDLSEWQDVCRYAESEFERHAQESWARRVEVLGDLLTRTARFEDLQPDNAALNRRHVQPLLAALSSGGGALSRKAVKEKLALGEANLSRLINLLEAAGLLRRSAAGRLTALELTEDGHRAVENSAAPELPQPNAQWESLLAASTIGVVLEDREGNVTANSDFERIVGLPETAASGLASSLDDKSATDFPIGAGKWSRCLRLGGSRDLTASIWIDVSDLWRSIDVANSRARRAEAEAANLRTSREELSAQLVEFRGLHDAMHRKLGSRLASATNHVARALPPTRSMQDSGAPLRELTALSSLVQDGLWLDVFREQASSSSDALTVAKRAYEIVRAMSGLDVKASFPNWLNKVTVATNALATLQRYAIFVPVVREIKFERADHCVVLRVVADHQEYADGPMGQPSDQWLYFASVNQSRDVRVEAFSDDGSNGIEIVMPMLPDPGAGAGSSTPQARRRLGRT